MILNGWYLLQFFLLLCLSLNAEEDSSLNQKNERLFPRGATQLLSRKGLKINIVNRFQLDREESIFFERAYEIYFKKLQHPLNWFKEDYLKQIHRTMFGEIWEWAGVYYTGPIRNIGVESSEIPHQMLKLIKEVQNWHKTETELSYIEQSIWILHRLQQIHPFTNGNGRFARLVADLYLESLGGIRPDWPDKQLIYEGEQREAYIEASALADNGNFSKFEDLYKKYGARNPSIIKVVEDPYFKQNFSKKQRIEIIKNLFRYSCRINDGYVPMSCSSHMALASLAIYFIDLKFAK